MHVLRAPRDLSHRNNESSCCFLILSLSLPVPSSPSLCPFYLPCIRECAFARSFGPHLNLFLHHRAATPLIAVQGRSNFIPVHASRFRRREKQPVLPFYLLRVHRTSYLPLARAKDAVTAASLMTNWWRHLRPILRGDFLPRFPQKTRLESDLICR